MAARLRRCRGGAALGHRARAGPIAVTDGVLSHYETELVTVMTSLRLRDESNQWMVSRLIENVATRRSLVRQTNAYCFGVDRGRRPGASDD
jgi:hypothetical protein